MLNEKESAAAANDPRKDEITSTTTDNDTIFEMVGQLFRACSRINKKTDVAIYATYLDGKISVSAVYRGNSFTLAKDIESNPETLETVISALEMAEEVILWNARF